MLDESLMSCAKPTHYPAPQRAAPFPFMYSAQQPAEVGVGELRVALPKKHFIVNTFKRSYVTLMKSIT